MIKEKGFTVLDEICCIDSNGSSRFADIVAIDKDKPIANIVDPAVRYEKNDPEQVAKVDVEKKDIYEKYLSEKLREQFGEKQFQGERTVVRYQGRYTSINFCLH